jgi:hypothetical protein
MNRSALVGVSMPERRRKLDPRILAVASRKVNQGGL